MLKAGCLREEGGAQHNVCAMQKPANAAAAQLLLYLGW